MDSQFTHWLCCCYWYSLLFTTVYLITSDRLQRTHATIATGY
ncbi:MAG TPA: hypothetical protein VK203_06270 [Nostocaceae cyanobacterium]|nr:hypothetical protein [Nostocaceae cyanobacterium]